MAVIHWKNEVSGSFNTPALWTGGVVPAGTAGAALDAAGSTDYTVTSSVSNTVSTLTLASTATLAITAGTFTATGGTGTGANAGTIAIGNNTTFAVGAALDNSGTITLGSSGNTTELLLLTNTTLSGGGSVVLGNSTTNYISGASAAVTLTNVDNTISGAGQLGAGNLTLVNEASGVIKSVGSNALVLNTGANHVTNAGLLEGAGPGGLTLQGTTVDNTGTIEAINGAVVQLASATINGGTLTTAGTGAIQTASGDRGSVLDGVTNNGIVKLVNNTSLTLEGAITDNGTIELNSSGNFTSLEVAVGGATVTGGTILLTNNPNNSITGFISGARNAEVASQLTNSGVIRGAGTIGGANGNLSLNNQGTISAAGTTALIIQTGSAIAAGSNVVLNDGVLQSTNGNASPSEGGLLLDGIVVNNDGTTGEILATGLHTHVDLESSTVEGGVLKTLNGGVIDTAAGDRGSLLDGAPTAISLAGSLNVTNNTTLTIEGTIKTGGTQGVLSLNSTGNNTALQVSSAGAALTHLQVNLSDNANNFISGVLSGPVGRQTPSHLSNGSVLQGAGTIGSHLAITNNATIDAIGGNALVLTSDNAAAAADNLVNNSLLESTNPNKLSALGGLVLSGITVANATGSGVIEANGLHTHVDLISATIEGGTLITAANGEIDTANGDRGSVLDGAAAAVNVQGVVTITNNTSLTVKGAIDNTGTIQVSSIGNATDLVAGGATLTGKGQVTLSDNANNIVQGATAGTTLDNVDNTISGSGELGNGGLRLVNEAAGVINATGSAAALIINVGTAAQLTNTGLIEASGSAGLTIQSSTLNGSTGGTLQANNGSSVTLASATLVGGTLAVAGDGVIQTAGGDRGTVFDGVTSTVNNTGVLNINNNSSLTLQGALNNTGTLGIQSSNNSTDLVIDVTGATLSGGGEVTLSDNANNFIVGSTPGSILTNVDNVIDGAGGIGNNNNNGALGLTLVNDAAGVIEASGNNALIVDTGAGGGVTNSGVMAAGDGVNTGVLDISNTTLNNGANGQLVVNDGSTVNFASSTIEGGTLKTAGLGTGAFDIASGDFQTVFDGQANAISIDATLNILNNSGLTLQGTIDNNAGGVIALNSSGNNTQLVIDTTGATLQGGGQVTLTDNGNNRIVGNTNASTLTNVDNTIVGAGQLGAGAMTLVNQAKGVIDGTGTNTLTIDTGANTITNAGTIESDGTVVIDSAVANTGTLKVNSGLMQINAAVTQTGAGKITIGNGTLEIAVANAAEAVKFTTTSGILQLDNSQSYTGTVSGFTTSTGTELDLRDIGYNSATTLASFVENGAKTSGVLTVTDGTHTAHITLMGNYSNSTFDLASDGSNGTLVTDPPKTQHNAVAQFTQALAAFSPAESGTSGHAVTAPSTILPVVVMPKAA